MIKEKAMELVAALRSGKFQQCREVLRYDNTYCCLGVACEISGLSEFSIAPAYENKYTYLNAFSALPLEVQKYYGLRDNCGAFLMANATWPASIRSRAWSLATLNDEAELNFNQIADFIELNWEIL